MSAFLVNNTHINAIVTFAVKQNIIVKEEAQRVGEMLLRANIRSLKARYGDVIKLKELKYTYEHTPTSDAQVLKCISCLDYQSCEYDAWHRSNARKFLKELSSTYTLSNVSKDSTEYNKAMWEYH